MPECRYLNGTKESDTQEILEKLMDRKKYVIFGATVSIALLISCAFSKILDIYNDKAQDSSSSHLVAL